MGTGNPQRSGVAGPPAEVYPRGHGESRVASTGVPFSSGLSPWARGILAHVAASPVGPRSIPVGTGNPSRREPGVQRIRVYPRGHGESPEPAPSGISPDGLSPWARGILCFPQRFRKHLGSIPVGTGNPIPASRRKGRRTVYPRGHGESFAVQIAKAHLRGLSPWARGIHVNGLIGHLGLRSIPVGTGNPSGFAMMPRLIGVYPRGHGESLPLPSSSPATSGLSPWARGIPFALPDPVASRGSIPVGTGNP